MNTPIKSVSVEILQKRNRFSFGVLVGGLCLAGFAFLYIKNAEPSDSIAWPLRKVLNFNGQIAEHLENPARIDAAQFAAPKISRARVNGDIGLKSPLDLQTWRLQVVSEGHLRTEDHGANFTLEELRQLPKTEENVQFKCIEGWSEVMSFGGVRFVDFLKTYHLGTKSGGDLDFEHHPEDAYRYVGMSTPDDEYYVSIDLRSLTNPQALLAYEQDGAALTPAHGFPLRLYVPNKYGVKSIKRIGKITFSDSRPPDYWQEEGYDWFNGL